jgi:hypothetical protein
VKSGLNEAVSLIQSALLNFLNSLYHNATSVFLCVCVCVYIYIYIYIYIYTYIQHSLFCSQEDEVSGIVLFGSSGDLPGWCVKK